MTVKTWETRAEMRDYSRELLTRHASKFAKKSEINLITDLQSRLVPDEVDKGVLGRILLAVCDNFDKTSLVLD